MNNETSSLELSCLIKEFQVLIGGKIDKIYQQKSNKREFLFRMHVPSHGKKQLRVIAPGFIYLSEYKQEFTDSPPGYCTFLRKHLGNARIEAVRQVNFERIVEIIFDAKEGKLILIIELFSKGNIILCKEDYTIISPLENQRWKDRTVRGGVKYEFPPPILNLLEIDETSFIEIAKNSKKDSIVKVLAADLGLGGLYAEEVCLKADIDKKELVLNEDILKRLFSIIKSLLRSKIKPVLIGEEAVPFELQRFKDEESKSFKNFSEAIDAKLSKELSDHKQVTGEKKRNVKLEKIQVIIDQQELTIKNMTKSADENQKKGELIYEHYNELNKILEDLNAVRKKHSWAEIKEKLKGHAIIKDVNDKEGKITVELK